MFQTVPDGHFIIADYPRVYGCSGFVKILLRWSINLDPYVNAGLTFIVIIQITLTSRNERASIYRFSLLTTEHCVGVRSVYVSDDELTLSLHCQPPRLPIFSIMVTSRHSIEL